MTTLSDGTAHDDVFSELDLTPTDVPDLPAKARSALIAYLLRWQYLDEAERCLRQLLISHAHLTSVYDNLARLHLARGEADRAVEIMKRRHAIRVSNSSRALEARAHQAAGDTATAMTIADQLAQEHPDLLLTWYLQAELRLANDDLDVAEAAWRRRETLQPGTAFTAQGIARIWQARGDLEKALLWASTALSRSKRDGRPPTVDLLLLLLALYQETGQQAQVKATATELKERQQLDLERIRQTLDAELLESEPPIQPSALEAEQPVNEPTAAVDDEVFEFDYSSEVIAGGVEFTAEECAQLDEGLRDHFGLGGFRPGQADVVAAVLRGDSVLAVMPTGYGKSLCYQLAAMLTKGTTLVISPLIALMKDQLDGLPTEVASQATTLNSTLEGRELEVRMARAAAGGYKLLYAAPERLRQRPFLRALKQAGVSLLVVDEAHCVSLWGHDFRPDYHFIAEAWRELGEPTILGMTATATPRVRDDIQAALGKMRLVAVDIHRPNLRLEARHMAKNQEKDRTALALCREIQDSGIIYATSRDKCEKLASMLRRGGVPAIHYHAGISDRAAAQDRFMSGEVRVVVATIAFGMGVDKSDVRFIIHYAPPKSLESYYQEAGRAGRDGLPARCILFHSSADKGNLTRWTHQEALSLEFLRQVYATVRHRIGSKGIALVATADLERDLVADSTKVRVAVHFLERAGLLWRGFDLPRTASLTLRRPVEEGDLERFVQAARLRPGQTVSRNLLSVCHEAGLDPRQIEDRLCQWMDEGWLYYRGIGRDMLLALPQPPADSNEKVIAMLAEHQAGQDGRIGEIMAYATTKRCRHGYISAYFKGKPIERCKACDNCLGLVPKRPAARPKRVIRRTSAASPAPGVQDPARAILEGVANLPYPLGRTGLMRALQGARTSPVDAERFSGFGALNTWTQKKISAAILDVLRQGYLEHFEKSGYSLLRLTARGQDWLTGEDSDEPAPLVIESQPPKSDTRRQGESTATTIEGKLVTQEADEYDEELYQRLRAWRLEVAREMGKPPYIVFPNTVLKSIAASKPTTLEGLIAIKGIGPAKQELYGKTVLDIVAGLQGE